MTARVFLIFAVLAAACLTGCEKATTQAAPEPAAVTAARNPLAVKASPDMLKRVTLGEVKESPVAASIRVSAHIEPDDYRVTLVSSPVTGRIVENEIHEGEPVTKGQVLAVLHSTELTESQFSFVKTLSQRGLAQRAAERAKQLLAADVIGSAELQRREAELTQAEAEYQALRDQLTVLGMSPDDIAKLEKTRVVNSRTVVVAGIDGVVLDRKISVGQVVQPAETMFVLADLSSVWLVADVPEQIGGNLEAGKLVEAEITSFPGQIIRGRLSFVSKTVDPRTRTIRTRMDLANPKLRYKPEMFATMTLKDSVEKKPIVPMTAVVRENNADFVFVQTAADEFLMTPVQLGEEHDGARVLAAGLNTSDRIVTDGAFHLNNERKRMALQGQ
jgi:cobalt-zinc-cadmium efflux system membrane fusion protein